jgi:hypothetical protein
MWEKLLRSNISQGLIFSYYVILTSPMAQVCVFRAFYSQIKFRTFKISKISL